MWKEAGGALKTIIGNQAEKIGQGGLLKVEGQKGIRLPNGLYLQYPNLRKQDGAGMPEYVYDTKKGRSIIPNRIYGPKVVENVCQALARIIIGEQMLAITKKYKVAMTVHDSVVALVPEHEAEEGKEFIMACMRLRPKWATDLPLNCEAGVGRSYGDC